MTCGHCHEEIKDAEPAVRQPNQQGFHRECFCRMISGSVGHQRKECSCYGKEDTSEQGLSVRDAARRAFEYARDLQALRAAPDVWVA